VVEFRRTLCTAHVQLAELLVQAREPERPGPPLEEAVAWLEALERALELAADGAERNPDDVDLYSLASGAAVWKARALAELGRTEEARGELARSAELDEQVLSPASTSPGPARPPRS
jgi:hypothetical protein